MWNQDKDRGAHIYLLSENPVHSHSSFRPNKTKQDPSNSIQKDPLQKIYNLDPYVKLYMVYNGQRIAKKKSHVKKRTLSPVYNESFVFELPSSDMRDLDSIQFEIVVMDWDRVTKNEVCLSFFSVFHMHPIITLY